MPIEHGVALVPPVPGVEGIVGQDQTDPIPNVLLLVVLYLHKLVSKCVVVQELIVVVAQYQVLLTLQVLEKPNRRLGVVARHIPQYEYMVCWLNYGVPVVGQPVVVVLRPIQLVVRERQVVLRPSQWVRVSLISKVYV